MVWFWGICNEVGWNGFFFVFIFFREWKEIIIILFIFFDKIGFFIIDYMKILFIKFICINI